MNLKKKLIALSSALVAVVALSATVSTAQAQPYHGHRYSDRCEVRIERAENRLHRAVRRHGRHSYQARERRRELRHIRRQCDRGYRRHHRPY